jgi:metal-responsive CopG/Arc/MetJ family transcriptional regulator
MPAKPVQISMDTELLRSVDRDPEVRLRGRSAVISSAVRMYLAAKDRQQLEARLASAYGGQADVMLEEVRGLVVGQAWPTD